MEEKWWSGIWLKNTKWMLIKKEWPVHGKLLAQTTTQDDIRIPHAKKHHYISSWLIWSKITCGSKRKTGNVLCKWLGGDCGARMPRKNNKVYRFVLFLFYVLSSIAWRVSISERECFLEGNDSSVPLTGFNSTLTVCLACFIC